MTESNFIEYWNKVYPESFPIGHELKWVYPDKWFRIHSLPGSKRYAGTEDEYKIILDRQNQILCDLFGEGIDILVLFGLYKNDISNDNYKELHDFDEFKKVWTINLKKERPKEYEDEMYLDFYVKSEIWQKNILNHLLKDIADDKIRALIICPLKNCVVAPYDGGVDIIVDSEENRDKLKIIYKDWLSDQADGL